MLLSCGCGLVSGLDVLHVEDGGSDAPLEASEEAGGPDAPPDVTDGGTEDAPSPTEIDAAGEVGTTTTCSSNADCATGDYCQKTIGHCNAQGSCAVKPASCSKVLSPACGCNGTSYDNSCYAHKAGVDVDYLGVCE